MIDYTGDVIPRSWDLLLSLHSSLGIKGVPNGVAFLGSVFAFDSC